MSAKAQEARDGACVKASRAILPEALFKEVEGLNDNSGNSVVTKSWY